jgi:hypothetical protein
MQLPCQRNSLNLRSFAVQENAELSENPDGSEK